MACPNMNYTQKSIANLDKLYADNTTKIDFVTIIRVNRYIYRGILTYKGHRPVQY